MLTEKRQEEIVRLVYEGGGITVAELQAEEKQRSAKYAAALVEPDAFPCIPYGFMWHTGKPHEEPTAHPRHFFLTMGGRR